MNFPTRDAFRAVAARQLMRQRQAQHLHALGPRPLLNALIEAAAFGDVDAVLERYSALDPDLVRALGGDRFPHYLVTVPK